MAVKHANLFDPSLEPERLNLTADTVVVGSCAGGAVVACALARGGRDVILLEEGGNFTAVDYKSERFSDMIFKLYRNQGVTFAYGPPHIVLPLGRCLGGTTAINAGTCLRMHEETFDGWNHEQQLSGITYQEIERAYGLVEPVMNVGVGPLKYFGKNAEVLMRGAEKMGYAYSHITRNSRDCHGSGVCMVGCPEDKKMSTNLSFVPRFLEAGGRVYVRCCVERVLMEAGKAVGVAGSVVNQVGRFLAEFEVRAKNVVLSCGALLTSHLLRKSGAPVNHAHLGRHLRFHPGIRVGAIFDEKLDGFHGVNQPVHVHQFLHSERISIENIFLPPPILAATMVTHRATHKAVMSHYPGIALLGLRIIDRGVGAIGYDIFGNRTIRYKMAPEDVRTFCQGMIYCAEIYFAAGAKEVLLPIMFGGPNTFFNLKEVKDFVSGDVKANQLEVTAYHPFGTTRMGGLARESVVSPEGECWGLKNLFVADGGIMPLSPYVNPQLTIMALSTLIAEKMLARP